MLGPKAEVEGGRGIRYHAKDKPKQGGGSEWSFEELDCPLYPTNMLLVRIMIGKVKERSRLAVILRNTPIRQDQPGWNCVLWIKEALERVKEDGKALGTSVLEWEKVRDGAMKYCQIKREEHRFDSQGNFDMRLAATYDLIEQKETIP